MDSSYFLAENKTGIEKIERKNKERTTKMKKQ